VLDIGCYSGFSAMAWFEGTRETGAEVGLLLPLKDSSNITSLISLEIITVEADSKMAAIAKEAFDKYGYASRISVLEGFAPDVSVSPSCRSLPYSES
jgi:hypothetical protein